MYTQESYEDHLNRLNILSLFAIAMGVEDDGLERCAMCGDRHAPNHFDTYNNQRMCLPCVALEKENELLRMLDMIDGNTKEVKREAKSVKRYTLIPSTETVHRPCG